MGKKERLQGSITLETSIILPIFMLFFFFVFGLFSIVNAQNQMTHALIQSTRSLSLDAYLYEQFHLAGEGETIFWKGLEDMLVDIVRLDNNIYFTSPHDGWHAEEEIDTDVIKLRFIGYLTGGDRGAAEQKLEALQVVGGLDGINFEASVEGEMLTVVMKYKLQYWFDFADLGVIEMEQSIKNQLWK
uniref:TadE/TadG family type IV pilus assembly protein n=1 Tax=Agathobacter sp. TaxID=2021311 RepID=UPI004057A1FD